MRFDILTIFPEFFASPLDEGIVRRALAAGKVAIAVHDIRAYATDRHATTDDRPFGGGEGMVMKPEPLAAAIRAARAEDPAARVIYMGPHGRTYDQRMAEELAGESHLVLLCGRYEGIDERIRRHFVDEEISIGDYILTGGELPSLVMSDAILRNVEGVLGNSESLQTESFETALLEAPSFAKPPLFQEMAVPSEFLKGNHSRIAALKSALSECKTKFFRPEQLIKHRKRTLYEK